MSINYLSPINLSQNELQNARIQNLATDPSSPVLGQIWFNTATNFLKVYDGTAARVLAEIAVTSLSSFTAPTAPVSFGAQTIQNLGAPVNSTDAATKAYVDNVAALGLDFHNSVAAATTGNVSIASGLTNGTVIDGVTLVTGNRVLVKNQTTASQNGIYVVPASGAASLASDMTNGSYVSGSIAFVEQGTVNAGSAWVVQTQGTITVGTTAVSWVQFAGGATYTAGSGLTLTGSVFAVNPSGNSLEIVSNAVRVKSSANTGAPLLSAGTGNEAAYGALNLAGGSNVVTGTLPIGNGGTGTTTSTGTGSVVLATSPTLVTPALGTPSAAVLTNATGLPLTTGVTGTLPISNGGTGATTAAAARANLGTVGKYTGTIGDGSTTSIVVTHNLNTTSVLVSVAYVAAPYQQVQVETQATSANTITLVFATAPASASLNVTVIG